MNWDRIEGNWKQLSGAVREKWGNLTNDDLEFIAGRRERLVGRLQERYGYLREDAQKRADEWMRSLRDEENEPGRTMHGQP